MITYQYGSIVVYFNSHDATPLEIEAPFDMGYDSDVVKIRVQDESSYLIPIRSIRFVEVTL
jgi:hypothetical protein